MKQNNLANWIIRYNRCWNNAHVNYCLTYTDDERNSMLKEKQEEKPNKKFDLRHVPLKKEWTKVSGWGNCELLHFILPDKCAVELKTLIDINESYLNRDKKYDASIVAAIVMKFMHEFDGGKIDGGKYEELRHWISRYMNEKARAQYKRKHRYTNQERFEAFEQLKRIGRINKKMTFERFDWPEVTHHHTWANWTSWSIGGDSGYFLPQKYIEKIRHLQKIKWNIRLYSDFCMPADDSAIVGAIVMKFLDENCV